MLSFMITIIYYIVYFLLIGNNRKKHGFQDYFGYPKMDIYKMSIFKNPGLFEMKKTCFSVLEHNALISIFLLIFLL